MAAIMVIFTLLMVLIVFDIAAWRWGYDSSEPFDSPEWERRRTWRHERMRMVIDRRVPHKT
jgi:hypothetical protein